MTALRHRCRPANFSQPRPLTQRIRRFAAGLRSLHPSESAVPTLGGITSFHRLKRPETGLDLADDLDCEIFGHRVRLGDRSSTYASLVDDGLQPVAHERQHLVNPTKVSRHRSDRGSLGDSLHTAIRWETEFHDPLGDKIAEVACRGDNLVELLMSCEKVIAVQIPVRSFGD